MLTVVLIDMTSLEPDTLMATWSKAKAPTTEYGKIFTVFTADLQFIGLQWM